MSQKELITVLLTIKKKTSHVAVEVPEHEVPILREIHGTDAVEIIDTEYGTMEIPDSAEAELARLSRKYDGKHLRVVAAVYTNLGELARHVGLSTTFDPLALEQHGPPQASQIDEGAPERKEKAKAAREAKKAPRKAAAKAE